jgi:hypothetical protein
MPSGLAVEPRHVLGTGRLGKADVAVGAAADCGLSRHAVAFRGAAMKKSRDRVRVRLCRDDRAKYALGVAWCQSKSYGFIGLICSAMLAKCSSRTHRPRARKVIAGRERCRESLTVRLSVPSEVFTVAARSFNVPATITPWHVMAGLYGAVLHRYLAPSTMIRFALAMDSNNLGASGADFRSRPSPSDDRFRVGLFVYGESFRSRHVRSDVMLCDFKRLIGLPGRSGSACFSQQDIQQAYRLVHVQFIQAVSFRPVECLFKPRPWRVESEDVGDDPLVSQIPRLPRGGQVIHRVAHRPRRQSARPIRDAVNPHA